ncbi:MAG TPA: dipeptidase [Candidatus Sphingobacterium stercorigallinarum]|nr:dipeptidase [Candidatus Sphingobacterium stercorigallinarum]
MKYALFSTLFTLLLSLTATSQDRPSLHSSLTVVDGHNDVIITSILKGRDIGQRLDKGHTDIPRLIEGGVDVQLFAVWSNDKKWQTNAFQHAGSQIDALEQVLEKNSDRMELATQRSDVDRINAEGKIAAVIGIEGGNMIESNLSYLEKLHQRGAIYLTLTWNYNLSWAAAAAEAEEHRNDPGLSDDGKKIIKKMNELGMMIDLSHSSKNTFYDVLEISTKPVLVSHSNASALTPHFRNLDDQQLAALKKNKGVIGVNFYSDFLDSGYVNRVEELYYRDHPRAGQGETAPSIGKMYASLSPADQHRANTPMENLLQHIDYLVSKVGIDHVAIGSDYDGIESPPQGLEDVSKLPHLTAALTHRGYSEEDIAKIMGENFLRIWSENEEKN